MERRGECGAVALGRAAAAGARGLGLGRPRCGGRVAVQGVGGPCGGPEARRRRAALGVALVSSVLLVLRDGSDGANGAPGGREWWPRADDD